MSHEASKREWENITKEHKGIDALDFRTPPLLQARLVLGKETGQLTFAEKGKPHLALGHLTLQDKHTGVEERRPLSSLVSFDKQGKVLWMAP